MDSAPLPLRRPGPFPPPVSVPPPGRRVAAAECRRECRPQSFPVETAGLLRRRGGLEGPRSPAQENFKAVLRLGQIDFQPGDRALVCSRLVRACSTSWLLTSPACARHSVIRRVSDWLARLSRAMDSSSRWVRASMYSAPFRRPEKPAYPADSPRLPPDRLRPPRHRGECLRTHQFPACVKTDAEKFACVPAAGILAGTAVSVVSARFTSGKSLDEATPRRARASRTFASALRRSGLPLKASSTSWSAAGRSGCATTG